VTTLVEEHGLTVCQACRIARLSRAAFYRPPKPDPDRDAAVITALQGVVAEDARWGFWKCYDRLRTLGHDWNHKRLHRVYCALRLNLPRRVKKRVPTRERQPLEAPQELNRIWALDFMADRLYDGRPFRVLNVLDEANREALAIEPARSLPSLRVVAVLEQLVAVHGPPAAIRCDNGPELIAETLTSWCRDQAIALHYIQPGKPDQNAFIERFNRTYREEVLNAWLFTSLEEVREISETWRHRYNTVRPHDSLGRVPPLTYLPRPTAA